MQLVTCIPHQLNALHALSILQECLSHGRPESLKLLDKQSEQLVYTNKEQSAGVFIFLPIQSFYKGWRGLRACLQTP